MQTRFIVRTLVTSTIFLICSAGILTALAAAPDARVGQDARKWEAGYDHESLGHKNLDHENFEHESLGHASHGPESEAVNNSHFHQNQD